MDYSTFKVYKQDLKYVNQQFNRKLNQPEIFRLLIRLHEKALKL